MTKTSSVYTLSDLAAECVSDTHPVIEHDFGFATISEVKIADASQSELYGKPIGNYTTISFTRPWTMADADLESLIDLICAQLKSLTENAAPDCSSVLITGLGNRSMTADALGPLTADRLNVTRHLKTHEPGLFKSLASAETAALVPGVVGQTGIETLEIIRGAVETVKPDLLIVVDSLAARSIDRLATTIQLTDSGIAPGSGIGNHRRAITRESVGTAVIAIGAPTVVSSSTLVYDALYKAKITAVSDDLKSVLENGRSYFVTPKEADTAVNELAVLISEAINRAFSFSL